MKKALFDLSIEEFVRVLCGIESKYTIDLTPLAKSLNVKGETIFTGNYKTLKRFLQSVATEYKLTGLVEDFEQSHFDYDMIFTYLDIYDYLEYKTRGFQKDRCIWFKKDLKWFYEIIQDEDGRERGYNPCDGDYNKTIKLLNTKIRQSEQEEAAQPKEEDTTGQAAEQPQQEQAEQGNATTTGATESEQPQSTGTIQQEPILPSELNTPEARKYFAKARKIGLMNDNYKWLKGKQLLACFCHDMSQKLNLGKGNRLAWKPFEVLFDIEKGKLRSNYNDIQKTGQNPSDIALVDKVFK